MAKKLSDAEFVERTRTMNRRRSERQRQRLMEGGKSALTVWLPGSVRSALTAKAANDGATIQDTAAALLSAALSDQPNPVTRPAIADSTADLFSEPGQPESTDTKRNEPVSPADFSFVSVADKAALMAEVGAMLESGLSGGEVARRLNAAGHRTAKGTEFSGANLLRDYRKWTVKKAQ